MHRNDVIAILSTLVGVASLASDGAFGTSLDTVLGSHIATIALAALGIVGMVAGQVIRALNAPAQTPATPPPNPTSAGTPPQNGHW